MNKKAISPVITTILLVLIVLILAALIILWAQGFITERISKFDQPVENSCANVNIQTTYSTDGISIINIGNIPIFKFGFNELGGPSEEIQYSQKEFLLPGQSKVYTDVTFSATGSIEVIPILLAKNEEGNAVEFQCPENNYFILER